MKSVSSMSNDEILSEARRREDRRASGLPLAAKMPEEFMELRA